jgi:putative PEP-CTERM system TPR-repeat lipoprotein
MNHGTKSSSKAWTRLFLGTIMGGLLTAATAASADVPKPTAPVQVDSVEVRKLLADAQAAIKNGNYRLALIILKNAVQVAPSNNDAHIQLGLALARTGASAGAEKELRMAWKGGAPEATVLPILFKIMLARREYQELLDAFPDPGAATTPTTLSLLRARALALQNLGRASEATDTSDRALKLRRDGEGLLARASLSLQQGDLKSAKKFADEAMKASPSSIEIAIFELYLLKAGKDDVGALAFSNQLLAKFSGNLDVQIAHIQTLLDQKQYPKAKAEIDGILAKRPGLEVAVYYQALLASRTGNARGAWDLAVTLPEEFLEVSPGVGLSVAQMAVDAGHTDAAADILGRVLGRDAGDLAVRLRLASLYLDQSNAISALNVLAPVENSSDPETVRLLSRLYTALNRKDDAQTVLKRLGATREHALVELQAGRTEQAIAELKEVAAREPGNVAVAQPLVSALVGARRFPEALAVADRLGQDLRRRATALVYRGSILMVQHNFLAARSAFDDAIALAPKDQAARLARADFLIATKKYDDASKDLRAVLSSDPKNSASRIKLADIAQRQGNDQEVRRILGEAIALSPRDASPRLALIGHLMTHSDLKGALRAADDLLRLQPSNLDGITFRGQIQMLLGQKQEAVQSFSRLVSLTPDATLAQLMLAKALFAADDRAGALRALDAAAELNPESPLVRMDQINLQFAFGNADTAVSVAKAFQASYPGSQADILFADTLMRVKRFDQATDVLVKSLAGKPDQTVLSRLVRLKTLAGDKKAAANLMSQWLARNPDDVAVRQDFAAFLMGEKDYPSARAQYEAILKKDADNALAMNNLGWMLQSSDPGRASALLTRAWQLAPNSAEVADTLGWFKLKQQKDAAGGLVLLQRAHDLKPQDGGITYHLAVALDANTKRDAARVLLKSLLASGPKFEEQPDALRLAAAWR